jgi:hypothetical protein
MPVYDFRCEACSAERRASVSADAASSLTLVCVTCGGSMYLAPVLKVAFVAARRSRDLSASTALSNTTAKACGHSYTCRCSIKLERPNPFKADIDNAHGKTPEGDVR